MVKLTLISTDRDTQNLVRIKLRYKKAHLVFFNYFNTRKIVIHVCRHSLLKYP